MKIGIILGSVRTNRVGDQIAAWALEQVASSTEHTFEIVDLKSFNLPLYTSPMAPMMLGGKYELPEQQAWADKIAEFDGYLIVTAEYNHGIPGALKNAIDSLGPELTAKRVGFIGYSYDGAIRAVEQLRGVLANFSMHDVRAQVSINLNTEFVDGTFTPGAHQAGALATVVSQLTA
ncbi:NAD(P)H-dependent oxidoreductase [Staphylococcus chromogenes]|nr:NAD(P)H-dependent oxidoreductase [Staphylococcus chromogenes]